MSTEIRINVVIRVPDGPGTNVPLPSKTMVLAWEAFSIATIRRALEEAGIDFDFGPARPGRPPRSRKGKPQLTTVKPPPTAA